MLWLCKAGFDVMDNKKTSEYLEVFKDYLKLWLSLTYGIIWFMISIVLLV